MRAQDVTITDVNTFVLTSVRTKTTQNIAIFDTISCVNWSSRLYFFKIFDGLQTFLNCWCHIFRFSVAFFVYLMPSVWWPLRPRGCGAFSPSSAASLSSAGCLAWSVERYRHSLIYEALGPCACPHFPRGHHISRTFHYSSHDTTERSHSVGQPPLTPMVLESRVSVVQLPTCWTWHTTSFYGVRQACGRPVAGLPC